jgi:DNA-binding Lrp family transcriptional regulator
MESSEIKKIKAQALAEARSRTGAHKQRIDLSDSEWAAIQAGAISNNKLEQILNNSDLDKIKGLATPKSAVVMNNVKKLRAKAMLDAGYTTAEVADALGVSLTTLKNTIGE